MKSSVKKWLSAATALVLVGLVLFAVVMTALHWDFAKLGTVEYESRDYPVDKTIRGVSIQADTEDIRFVPSEDGACRVVCQEAEGRSHKVQVRDGVLTIEALDERDWKNSLSFSFQDPRITVYLPRGDYGALSIRCSTGDVEIPADFRFESMEITGSTGDVTVRASVSGELRIRTSTGDIRLEDISAGSASLTVSTGEISAARIRCEGAFSLQVSTGRATVRELRCRSLSSTGSTGDLTLQDVVAEEMLSAERSTGDVRLERCDAAELFLKTSTGDVSGSLRSSKIFFTSTRTGDVDVPRSTSGGACEIQTSTGDITITIQP